MNIPPTPLQQDPPPAERQLETGFQGPKRPVRANMCSKHERGGRFSPWGPLGTSWGFLGPPGVSWALLGSPRASWGLLVPPGASWASWGPLGVSWGLLGLLGPPGSSWGLL